MAEVLIGHGGCCGHLIRKLPYFVLGLLIVASACEQRTETRTVTDTNGTVQSQTTTVSATMPAVDTAATAEAKKNATDAAHAAADTTRDAAHATGTAMETAGKEIQRQTGKKH